jgi:hypothetical protein
MAQVAQVAQVKVSLEDQLGAMIKRDDWVHGFSYPKYKCNMYRCEMGLNVVDENNKAQEKHEKQEKYSGYKVVFSVASTMEKVCKALTDIENSRKWNTIIKNVKVLKKVAEDTDWVWYTVSLPIIQNRDFIIQRRFRTVNDKYFITSFSVKSSEHKTPLVKDHTRGWSNLGGFLVQPDKNDVRVTWILNTHMFPPGSGILPQSFIHKTTFEYCKTMIKLLAKHL